MYCKKCGKEIDFDSTFCSYCGTKQSLNQSLENRIVADTKPNPGTHIINIAKSFETQTANEKYEVVKIDKFDRSYKGDVNAAIAGIVVLILSSILLAISRQSTDPSFIAFYWISLLLWWIIAIPWVVKIANRQNRSTIAWGIFAFFLPYLAIIIIGLLKKLLIPTSITSSPDLGSNSQESNNITNSTSNKIPDSIAIVPDLIKYSIINSNTKRSFFKSYDDYTIEFFDNKRGHVYSFDSVTYFINHYHDNSAFYYSNKESAIKALYLYLTKKETLKDDLSYSR